MRSLIPPNPYASAWGFSLCVATKACTARFADHAGHAFQCRSGTACGAEAETPGLGKPDILEKNAPLCIFVFCYRYTKML